MPKLKESLLPKLKESLLRTWSFPACVETALRGVRSENGNYSGTS